MHRPRNRLFVGVLWSWCVFFLGFPWTCGHLEEWGSRAWASEASSSDVPASASPVPGSAPVPEKVPEKVPVPDSGSATADPMLSLSAEGRLNPTRFVKLPQFLIFKNPQDFLKPLSSGSVAKKSKSKAVTPSPVETQFDYSAHRFHVILALATWSERAKEMAKFFEQNAAELATRKIGVVGLFTHDSYEDIAAMAKEHRLTFALAKGDIQLVKELLNPKIPTIWVADHNGQVIYRLIRPNTEGIEQTYRYLLSWTDF